LETPGHLTIAADCGTAVGTGHAMRCLALAQVWQRDGGGVTFLVPEGSPLIEERIRAEGCGLQALIKSRFARAVVERLRPAEPGMVALDGYGFGAWEQSSLSEAGWRVLMIDDFAHASAYPASWVLNQNVYAREEMYAQRGVDTRLLLGASYALLRQEFHQFLGWTRDVPDRAHRLLISIGGSDACNLSARILESLVLLERKDIEVVLIAGGANPHFRELQTAVQRSQVPVRLIGNALDMPSLMAWADIAISGAGGTSYELCYMGLPALLFVTADNQRRVAERLSGTMAAICAGEAGEFDAHKFTETLRHCMESPEEREAISNRGRELVDGMGAARVKAAMLNQEIRLRAGQQADCRLLFSWANDPEVRKASFHSNVITWPGHQSWYAQKLADPQSVIYIGQNWGGEPVGVVRFQMDGDRAVLSVSIAPQFRGAGFGKGLTALSVQTLARRHSVRAVEAFVKPDNHASIHLFESCGFHRRGCTEVAGQPALLFTWDCPRQPNA